LSVFVVEGPLGKENLAFCADFGVGHGVCCGDAEALEKWLVGEGALEGFASIGDEGVEDLLTHATTP